MRARARTPASVRAASDPGRRVDDHLGQHRVVERRHLAAGLVPGVDAQPRSRGDLERRQHAGLRGIVGGRVLGVQPHLDRVALRLADVEGAGATFGARELQRDEVDWPVTCSVTGCSTWSRVFISRNEERPAVVVEQELHGAGSDVSDRCVPARRRTRARPRVPPGEVRGGRLLDHLLVTALERAVALAEHLDRRRARRPTIWTSTWRRVLDVGLDEDGAVAERRRRLGPGGRDLVVERGPDRGRSASRDRRRRRTPSPAAAGRPAVGGPGALEHGHAGRAGELLRPHLRAHRLDRVRRSARPRSARRRVTARANSAFSDRNP